MSMKSFLRAQFFALGLVVLSLFLPQATFGEDPLVGSQPWSSIEQLLLQEGIQTDADTLLKAVEHNPNFAVRAWASAVLGMRHEQRARDVLRKAAQTDSDQMVREEAWMALARLGDSSALGPLEDLLKQTSGLDRQARLAAKLAEVGDPAGYPYVEQAADSPQAELRVTAVRALVQFVPLHLKQELASDPFARLAALAQDRDSKVRFDALIYLQVAVSKGASATEFATLLERIAEQDQDKGIREQARRQLALLELLTKHKKPGKSEEKQ
jgi:HEAT repeat protein